MTESDHDYVFIAHGTFNPPAPAGEPPHWYQPGGQFAVALAQALERLSPEWKEAVWRSTPALPDGFFHWSGANTHTDRTDAARRLSEAMLSIWDDDPQARLHLIGHSHGGNVILKALELYGQGLARREDTYRRWPGRPGGRERAFPRAARLLMTEDIARQVQEAGRVAGERFEQGARGGGRLAGQPA